MGGETGRWDESQREEFGGRRKGEEEEGLHLYYE